MSHAIAFVEGAHCLLRVMGQQFWVRITEAGEDAIRVSFPGYDYPLEGMQIELEVHDEEGYRVFSTHMIGRGATLEDGIILSAPTDGHHRTHRGAVRIETELPVVVKDLVSLQRHEGKLVNLSQGGALFSTMAPFDFDTTVEMTLELPEEPAHTLMGQVRHVDAVEGSNERRVGIRFISPDSDAVDGIARYIAHQLRGLYPTI